MKPWLLRKMGVMGNCRIARALAIWGCSAINDTNKDSPASDSEPLSSGSYKYTTTCLESSSSTSEALLQPSKEEEDY